MYIVILLFLRQFHPEFEGVLHAERRGVPPEAALLFLLRKRELFPGVVALLCLVSMTDRS